MKKNGQYVGVDEKYIPEDEKYVDNSTNEEIKNSINDGIRSVKNYLTDNDNQEKFKETGRKGLKILKGVGIGYLAFIGFILLMIITVFVVVIVNMTKMIGKTDDVYDQAESIIDKVTDQIENNNGSTNTNGYSQMEIEAFNSPFEFYNGTQVKLFVSNLLERVVTNNKTEKEHTITVVYNEISTTNTDEIISLKQSLKDGKNYEVSLDYDTDGFVDKITLK